eukprot:Skav228428  [mRNA]  locus=scaffold1325:341488:342762:- [translate_table: standard]
MVLLSGTMIQLGGKAIKYKQGPSTPLPASGHLISITLHKDDWADADWQKALHQTPQFVKERLAQDGLQGDLQSMWGKSMRAKGAPATPLQALTLQLHGMVDETKMTRMLQCSGFNKLFMVPKTPDGRVSGDYRVIWLEVDLAAAIGLSAQLPDCLGLVRGKSDSNLGLRFPASKYDNAWKTIYPAKPVPKVAGSQVFKLEGLPFGCTKESIQQWLVDIAWDATAFKALGPNTWLLKADAEVPQGLQLYNSSPVLIRKLPPRNLPTEKVLLGRPSKQSTEDPWQTANDPWAPWAAGRSQQPVVPAMSSTGPPRQIQGPVEARFQAQEDKIQKLQTDLDTLTKVHDQRAQEVRSQLQHLDQQHTQHQKQVHQSLTQMQTDFDAALSSNLRQHSSRMDSKFDELKALLTSVKKRGQPEEQEDDDMHG